MAEDLQSQLPDYRNHYAEMDMQSRLDGVRTNVNELRKKGHGWFNIENFEIEALSLVDISSARVKIEDVLDRLILDSYSTSPEESSYIEYERGDEARFEEIAKLISLGVASDEQQETLTNIFIEDLQTLDPVFRYTTALEHSLKYGNFLDGFTKVTGDGDFEQFELGKKSEELYKIIKDSIISYPSIDQEKPFEPDFVVKALGIARKGLVKADKSDVVNEIDEIVIGIILDSNSDNPFTAKVDDLLDIISHDGSQIVTQFADQIVDKIKTNFSAFKDSGIVFLSEYGSREEILDYLKTVSQNPDFYQVNRIFKIALSSALKTRNKLFEKEVVDLFKAKIALQSSSGVQLVFEGNYLYEEVFYDPSISTASLVGIIESNPNVQDYLTNDAHQLYQLSKLLGDRKVSFQIKQYVAHILEESLLYFPKATNDHTANYPFFDEIFINLTRLRLMNFQKPYYPVYDRSHNLQLLSTN